MLYLGSKIQYRMKSAAPFSVLLFSLFVFIGCAPLYIPTSHNTPMFTGKNEFQASAGMYSGLNAQAAYSFTDHFAVAANYLYARYNKETDGRTQKVGELALGYYTNFDSNWCAEIFTGFGLGKGHAYDSLYYTFTTYDPYEANGKYFKIFVQPSIGMNKGNALWNFSVKLTYLNFTSVNIKHDDETLVKGKTSEFFAEPTITWQFPLKKKLFMFIQAGYNFPVGDPRFDYDPFVGSIGLVLKLPQKE
jgi:hypothetical protein